MILIAGGTGFIGVHAAKALLDAGQRVVLSRYGERAFQPGFLDDAIADRRCVIEPLDTSNAHDVIDLARRHAITGVVHLVQSTGANSLAEEFRANLGGLLNVLEAARGQGVRRVCIASSINVYDGLPGVAFAEDAPVPLGRDDAGFSGTITTFKKMEEVFAGYYAARTGLQTVSLRFGHVWGPVNNGAGVMARIVRPVARGEAGPEAAPGGDADYWDDGRDYVYVKDVAWAIQRVLLAASLGHGAYNIGSGTITTNRRMAEAVCAAVPGAVLTFREGSRPQPQILCYGMDIGRIRDELGYQPRPLEEAVADYLAWLAAGNVF